MKKPNNSDRLRHILDAVERIEKHLNGYDKQTFEADDKTQDAVVRQMEIIGEAATNLTRDLRSDNPQVEWQIATAMRNRLIHGYFDVDTEIVWDTAQNNSPVLKTEIEKILKNLT